MSQNGMEKLCTKCWAKRVPHARSMAGFDTCLPCGEREARKRKHTIVPLHKSNYIVPANADEIRGINNKGGFYR
jgi:hypothetical protein